MAEKTKLKIVREAQLYTLWQQLCLAKLTTTDKRLTGVYAGQLNMACGPDYRGAEFELDGKCFRGDVEIHRERNDWFRHGHHLDWRYDNVQLHLVADIIKKDHDDVINSKGLTVPTLGFIAFPQSVSENGVSYNCRARHTDIINLEVRLRHLAQQRLQEKVNLFYRSALGDGLDQAFYRLLFRQLGHGQNSDLFERLALMLPWSSVQQIKKRYHYNLDNWEQLLMHLAGFKIKTANSIPAISGLTDQPIIPGHIWQKAGHRPTAHPRKRLLGMAHFISGLPEPYLFDTFLAQATKRKSIKKMDRIFIQVFLPDSRNGRPHYWGISLIREMIGNVVIPALYYYAELSGSEGFKEYLEQYYFWLPAAAFYNCLKKYHSWPELSKLENKFYIVQSLLKLQQNYCQASLCHLCPVDRFTESV